MNRTRRITLGVILVVVAALLVTAQLAGLGMGSPRPLEPATAGPVSQPGAASAAGAIGGVPQAGAAELPTRGITVVGQGKVSGKPDVARANVGIEVLAPTVAEATTQSNEKMAAVIAKLKDLGVGDKDVQTSNYSINPERNFQSGGSGQVTGYRVSNMVQVTIRDLTKVGPVLDQVTAAGANSVYGVFFGFDNSTKLEADARARAMDDARLRADDLARLSGVQRGDVLAVSEVIGSSPVPMAARAADMAQGGGASIQPGELDVQVQIQVTYAIR